LAKASGAPLQGKIRVLHVDDEHDQLSFTRILLEDADPEIVVVSAATPFQALDMLSTHPDCVVTDYQMTEMDGIELARKIKKVSDVPVILYTGRGSEEVASAAFAAGVSDYLRKEMDPGHFQVLARRIRHTVESWRTERILREAEERYRTLLDANMDAVYVIQDSKFTYANKRGAELLGFAEPSELLGKPIRDTVAPEDREKVLRYLRERSEGKSPPNRYEIKLLRKDGSIVEIETHVSLIDYNGAPASLSVSRDISNRKHMEEDLQKSQSRTNALHVSTLKLAASQTEEGVWGVVFDALTGVLGYKQTGIGIVEGDYLKFKTRFRVVKADNFLPLDGRGVTIRALRTLKTQMVHDTLEDEDYIPADPGHPENVFRSELAVPVVVDGKAIAVLNAESKDIGGFTDDDRKLIEILALYASQAIRSIRQVTQLRESEEKYRQLAENAADVLFTIDLDGVITYTSRDVNPYVGFTREEIVGRHVLDFVPPESRELYFNRFKEAHSSNDAWVPLVLQVRRKDGGVATLEFNPSRIMDGDTLVGIQVVSHDISTHIRQEKKLKSLHASALVLAQAESVADVWRKALEGLHDGLGFERISIGLVRDGAVHFTTDLGLGMSSSFSLPLDGRGISVKAIREKRSVNVRNSLADPEYVTTQLRQNGSPKDRSNLAVPIVVDGRAVAVFNIQGEEEDAFTEEDLNLTETLALHAASAISRINQNTAERRYSHRLEVLNRHANALERVEHLKDALVLTYDSLVSLGLRSPSISLLRNSVLNVQTVEGKDGIVPISLPMDGPGITVRAARTGRTQLVNDALSDPDLVPDPEGKTIMSELAVPVKIGDNIIGVLNLESTKPGAYTEEDARIVEMLASHFASTHQRIRQLERETRDKARIRALHGCALRLGATTTLDEIWDTALGDLSEALGFNTITLGLVEGGKIRFHRFVGIDIPPDLTVPLKESVLARVVRSNSTLMIPDTRLDPGYMTFTRNADGSYRYLSELATPIVVNGRVFAVLNSESERAHDYGPEDKMLMETMASHVSNAIARVRMMEDLQRTVEQRTSELLAAEQMATAGRVSAMVAHDLRGPLQTISNASQLVKTRPERAGEMISVINSAVARSLHMLEDLRLNTREDPLRLAATDLPELIAESLKELSPPKDVEIDLRLGDGLGDVVVDPLKVSRVLDNLLRNALEAMPGGGRLTVAAERASGELILEVADTGSGIPDEIMGKLFRPFLTTKVGGLGLGLPYCKKAVEAHGGSISAYSTPGKGTTFTVRLPAP